MKKNNNDDKRELLIRKYGSLIPSKYGKNVGFFVFDFTRRRSHWSRQLYKIFDKALGEEYRTVGDFLAIVAERDVEKVRTAFENALRKCMHFTIDFHVDISGNEKFICVTSEVIESGKDNKFWICTIEVINENAGDSDAEIRQLQHERDRAIGASHRQASLLANMGHDIRTPMNSILGFANILKQDATSPAAVQYLDGIIAGGNELMKIIVNLASFAKINAGRIKPNISKVNVESMFTEICRQNEYQAKDKNLDYEIKSDDKIKKHVLLDPEKVGQIMATLIQYAVGNTAKGTIEVEMKSEITPKQMCNLDLIVRYTGVNGKSQELDDIFNTESEIKKIEHNTLGLLVAKGLCGVIKASVFAVSDENGEHEIHLIMQNLPMLSSMAGEELPATEKADFSNLKFMNQNILVVDDSPNNILVMKNVLSKSNLKISSAESGADAVTLFATTKPEAILMDYEMPDMNGIEAARIIRKLEKKDRQVPIIIVTGHGANPEIDGLDGIEFPILTKPIDENDVKELLSKYLKYEGQETSDDKSNEKPNEKPESTKKKTDDPPKASVKVKRYWKTELGDLYTTAIETNDMEEIEKFAEACDIIAEKANSDFLRQCNTELRNALSSFNVKLIMKILPKIEQFFN